MLEDFTEEENAIRQKAIEYARKNRKAIARELTDQDRYPRDPNPVSVFMAGSPGAGKTEASKALIREAGGIPPVRIDPDESRVYFEDYIRKQFMAFSCWDLNSCGENSRFGTQERAEFPARWYVLEIG